MTKERSFIAQENPTDQESILNNLGLPKEPVPEYQKAGSAGIQLVSLDTADESEHNEFARKLKEESSDNVFGGFPSSFDTVASLVKTLREEWLEEDVPPTKIVIHSSCVNRHDCVILPYPDGKKCHYNTKNITGYSRRKMVSYLKQNNIAYSEI